MEARDLYGKRVRLTPDGLAYGEEFVPFDEMDDARPASHNLWNPATNLFEVAVAAGRTTAGREEPAAADRRPAQESDNRCPAQAPNVTHHRRIQARTRAQAAEAGRQRADRRGDDPGGPAEITLQLLASPDRPALLPGRRCRKTR